MTHINESCDAIKFSSLATNKWRNRENIEHPKLETAKFWYFQTNISIVYGRISVERKYFGISIEVPELDHFNLKYCHRYFRWRAFFCLTSKSLSLVKTGLSKVLHFLDVPRKSVPSIQIPYEPSEEPKTSVSRSQRTKNEFWPDHLNWSSSEK